MINLFNVKAIIFSIITNIFQCRKYLIPSIKYGGMAVFFIPLQAKRSQHRRNFYFRFFVSVMLFIYLGLVFHIVFLSREYGSYRRIDLLPFQSWSSENVNETIIYIVENMLLFIPIGFLLPLSFDFLQYFYRTVFLTVLLSAFIEVSQYIFETGYLQTDDLINNVLGSIVGYEIWNIIKRKSNKEKKQQ